MMKGGLICKELKVHRINKLRVLGGKEEAREREGGKEMKVHRDIIRG